MPPAPPEGSTHNTPLAPSVEKAYYRKCIELKRRLNEVEAANDEAKLRRMRLDRAILKMRLERAFLLEQLSKRMEHNIDGSEGSGDEGMATPPPERPHRPRDKRSGPRSIQPAAPHHSQAPPLLPSHAHHPPPYPAQRIQPLAPRQLQSGNVPMIPLGTPDGHMVQANAIDERGQYLYSHDIAAMQQQQQQGPPHHGSPYSAPVDLPGAPRGYANGMSLDGADDGENEDDTAISREAGATGEAVSAGPTIREDSNGQRRIVSDESRAHAELEQQQNAPPGAAGGFTAVNQRPI